MPHYEHLPIWRDARRLLIVVEEAVRQFARYHKYSVGSDLRRQCMAVCRLVIRASTTKHTSQKQQLERLVDAIEDLKLLIVLAKELKAFSSFKQFEAASLLAVSLGKQSGGWLRARSVATTC